jgi:leucine dehydrogenase
MNALELARELGHEELHVVNDRETGLQAFIALHDTTLGPAAGGTRMRTYPTLDAAAVDALRLARAMTAKAALCGVARGGGKAVILGDPARDKSEALLLAYGRAVDRLGGRFHTGPDMGFDGRDVAVMATVTPYVSHTRAGHSVEAADLAALGVAVGIEATARALGRELDGLTVALQGLGEVGMRLARILHGRGVRLVVADLDEDRVEQARATLRAQAVPPHRVYDVETDVFSPCAAGGVLDDQTIPRLRCRAVVGAANEQLAEPRHAEALMNRGILYAPDFVVNAGGLLSLLYELGETDEAGVVARVREIGPRVQDILERAHREGRSPSRVADRMVEERLAAGRETRHTAARPMKTGEAR